MADPRQFGPTRGELWFWLAVACGGLALMTVAMILRPPTGPALIEVLLLPGLMFGFLGSRSVIRLIRHDHPPSP